MMKSVPLCFAIIVACALAQPAAADCYADYKAKQEPPLRLLYGVAQLPDDACTKQAAGRALAPRLAQSGWKLLNIVSIFGSEGLNQRKDNAASSGQSLNIIDLR